MFEEEPKENHRASFTILGIFVLLLTVVGVAIAAYTWTYTSNNANSISTGNISMSLLESTDTISIENALPMSDDKGKQLKNNGTFDFAVTTEASGQPGDINYKLSITEDNADSDYTLLNKEQVKVYLTVLTNNEDAENEVLETQVVKPTKVSDIITENSDNETGVLTFDEGQTQHLTHHHNKIGETITTKYRLRMWISDDVDASNWNESTKYQYKLKINASGSIDPIQ